MTRDPLVIVATLSLAGLAFFLLIEHVPKWVRALASSKPFDGIRTALAPIALPGWIKTLGVLAWSALLVTLLAGMFFVILTGLAKLPGITPDTAPDLRWYLLTLTAITAALGAIIALPFTLRRTVQNERQTRTQEEGYVTQQINEAVANLAAEKEVSRVWRTVEFDLGERKVREIESISERFPLPESITEVDAAYGAWQLGHRTKPNIEVRIGAILALERLARQRAETAVRSLEPALKTEQSQLDAIALEISKELGFGRHRDFPRKCQRIQHRTPDGIIDHDGARDHVRIMEILCTYIRENAPSDRARAFHPPQWRKLRELHETEAYKMGGKPQKDLSAQFRSEVEKWARDHPGMRTDTQVALRVLGRRTNAQLRCEGIEKRVTDSRRGLNGTRLLWHGYRLDLRETDLQLADLDHSPDRPMRLPHARLASAQMQGAVLAGAQFQGANLWRADLRGAFLANAQLQGANLGENRLRGAYLRDAQMQGAGLGGTEMQGAYLEGAHLQGAFLRETQMQGANLWRAELTSADLSRAKMYGVVLTDAKLQGADLSKADLRRTNLAAAKIDANTELRPVTLKGAGLTALTLWVDQIGPDLLLECFGDTSVAFEGSWPDGFVITDNDGVQRANTDCKLSHWSPEVLDHQDFQTQWRAFQATLQEQSIDPD